MCWMSTKLTAFIKTVRGVILAPLGIANYYSKALDKIGLMG